MTIDELFLLKIDDYSQLSDNEILKLLDEIEFEIKPIIKSHKVFSIGKSLRGLSFLMGIVVVQVLLSYITFLIFGNIAIELSQAMVTVIFWISFAYLYHFSNEYFKYISNSIDDKLMQIDRKLKTLNTIKSNLNYIGQKRRLFVNMHEVK